MMGTRVRGFKLTCLRVLGGSVKLEATWFTGRSSPLVVPRATNLKPHKSYKPYKLYTLQALDPKRIPIHLYFRTPGP